MGFYTEDWSHWCNWFDKPLNRVSSQECNSRCENCKHLITKQKESYRSNHGTSHCGGMCDDD